MAHLERPHGDLLAERHEVARDEYNRLHADMREKGGFHELDEHQRRRYEQAFKKVRTMGSAQGRENDRVNSERPVDAGQVS